MQSLSLNEGSLAKTDAIPSRSRTTRSRSPRLPTPETSRSSYDASESERMSDSTRRTIFEQRPSIRPLSERDYVPYQGAVDTKWHSRRSSRTRPIPHSPPYDVYDGQRPSLPPLKTVLGDNLYSPPRTPTVGGTPLQPSPREPRYTVDTYKPPALYPNKKQRRESTTDAAQSFDSGKHLESPKPRSPTVDQNRPAIATSNISRPPPPTGYNLPIPRHQPVQGILYQARASSHSHNANEPSASESAKTHDGFGTNRSFTRSDQTPPVGSVTGFVFGRTRSSDQEIPKFTSQLGGPSLRSPEHPRAQPPWPREQTHSIEHNHTRDFAYQRDNRHPPRADNEDHRPYAVFEREQRPPSPHSGFLRTYVQSNQPTVWVPAMNDLANQRSKKRSNLPKNSTEIMRRWFDQNISNPYPTEEQKAVFSSHTGISMTQVSNWFINHRRRCPELRDRREKNRDRVARQCGQYED